VTDTAATAELLEAKYAEGFPEGQVIALQKDAETHQVLTAYLVSKEPDLTGDYLDDARVGFDPQQRPLVNFQFNPEGGKLFRDLTGSHLQEPLAIILDEKVYSAPTIQSRISMRGQISGRFTAQDAADLAVVLRAGSVAKLVQKNHMMRLEGFEVFAPAHEKINKHLGQRFGGLRRVLQVHVHAAMNRYKNLVERLTEILRGRQHATVQTQVELPISLQPNLSIQLWEQGG
jgi:hypothetical protein